MSGRLRLEATHPQGRKATARPRPRKVPPGPRTLPVVTGPDDDPNPADRLLDLLYTGVGLGILAVNRVQVARRQAIAEGGALEGLPLPGSVQDLQQLVDDPETITAVVEWLRSEMRSFDARIGGLERTMGEALDRLEPDLPDTARQFVRGLRGLAADHADQVRSLLGLES